MSVPQKEKEGPAKMLRAMFAGVGSLLSVVDKVRSKPAAEAPTAPAAATPETSAAPETVTPETVTPETVTPETVTPETSAAPETVTPETSAAPETVTPATSAAPEISAAPETSAAPEAAGALPLANYDELTVASLRARLRNLSVEQLTQLIEYEKGNAARPDVISMFERRIAKVEPEA
jgi:hypothetical protein